MQEEIAVVVDSTLDIPPELGKELGLTIVDTPLFVDGTMYLNSDITINQFLEMADNAKEFPTTSQPSPAQFKEAYDKLIGKGYKKIISIHLPEELSGTINSARIAIDMFEDDVEFYLIDTRTTSMGLLACVLYLDHLLKNKVEIDQIVERVHNFGKSMNGYFSVVTLDNLVRGGRLTRPRYILGKILGLNPTLLLKDGAIHPHKKTRGAEKSRNTTYEDSTGQFSKDDTFKYIIGHAGAPDVAKEYETRLTTEFPNTSGFIAEIGPAIAVHAGRGVLMIICYKFPEI